MWVVVAGVGDQGLAVAQVVADRDQAQRVHHAEGGILAARQLEGDDGAAALHLPHGQRVLGMAGAGGIQHAAAFRPQAECLGDLLGAVAHGAQAQRQGFQPLQQQPGIERRQAGAGVAHEGLQRALDPGLGAQHRAAQHAPLAVDMLGAGIDHHVRAQFHRALQQRGGEDVIDHDHRAGLVRQPADGGQVHDVEHGVGRAFQQHHRRRPGQRHLPGRQVCAVHELGLDAVARQQGANDPMTGPEQRAGRDQPVAGAQVRQQRGMYRGHAGGGHAAGFGAFQQREAAFQHGDGGVAEPAVLKVIDGPGEGGLRLLGTVIDEAAGQEHRFRRLAIRGARDAAVHQLGGGSV